MEFKFELDMHGIVAEATSPERVKPLIDKIITDALKRALEEATGWKSPFAEQLKTQLSESLPHGLRVHDVAKFQQMLNMAVSDAVAGVNGDALKVAMQRVTKSLLPEVPTRIKLSELLKEARSGFHKDQHEAFYAHYEESEYSSGGGWLYLDGNERTDRTYSAAMRLAFNGDGVVYALKLDGRDITPRSTPDAVGDFDGLLLSLYTGRTSLDIDINNYEVESLAASQED